MTVYRLEVRSMGAKFEGGHNMRIFLQLEERSQPLMFSLREYEIAMLSEYQGFEGYEPAFIHSLSEEDIEGLIEEEGMKPVNHLIHLRAPWQNLSRIIYRSTDQDQVVAVFNGFKWAEYFFSAQQFQSEGWENNPKLPDVWTMEWLAEFGKEQGQGGSDNA